VVRVSDGTATTSLPAFSITVAQALTTSARVSWRAPTTNVDGTPITGLSGFRVFYGNVSGQYGQSLLVSSPSITSVVIEGLTSSTTWYFVVKAVATSGVESDYSTEVSKTM
jgi:chitodextrinase